MGYKSVCSDCQKAYSMGTDFSQLRERICPDCGKMMIQVSHLFKPPKKGDNKQWEMVKYLIDNGFYFNHAYKYKEKGVWLNIPYPKTLQEAKEFVEKYVKDNGSAIYLVEKKKKV